MNAIVKLQHIGCCAAVLTLCQYYANAQSPGTIKGKINDENGNIIPSASIYNKNSRQNNISTAAGQYAIQAQNGDSIIIQMIGYDRYGFVAKLSGQPVNITLHSRSQNLKDVVVTALGIKREERELGYAFTEVNGDDINKAKETNVINSLAGKVAGLVINSTAGGPSGSSRVIIRGNTSITGNNQPLYVIDGIPMDNSNYGQVGDTKYAEGVDMGDAISAINPDDIEKISVLKGPSAAALYGSSAANGVILITTKKGSKQKELGIELSSTSTIEKQLTKVNGNQYLYGQGNNGNLPQDQQQAQNTMFTNFGPRLDPNVNIIGFDGKTRPYALAENNFGSFFRTGSSFNNTLSLTNATDKSNFRFSVGDLRYKDIVPNSDIRRDNFSFSARSKFGQYLDFDARATYLNERVNNRAGLGDAPTNVGQNFNGLANNIDQSVFGDNYKTASGQYVEWGGGQYRLNPYWVLYEMSNVTMKDRLTGAFNANITVNKHFSILARASTDITFLNYQKYSPPTTPLAISGMMNTLDQKYMTNQADVMATFTHKLSRDINLSARLGASLNQRQRKGTAGTFSNMTVTDVKSINSYQDKSIEESNIRREVRSGYGLVTLGYKDFLYIDGTIRTDASSTLPKGNNVYTYPSVSGSLIFTDAFNIKSNILSFGKLRASWAEVGSDTDPYMLDLYYSLYPLSFNGSQPANISTKIIPNKELKPTRTRSFETGLNMKFFNGRLTFDGTYYTSRSRDQINIVPAPVSSGFTKQIINAGLITNKGLELMLSGTPISKKDFSWDVSVNFARNINNVQSLAPDVPFITLSEARWLGLLVAAMPGQRYGSIIGYDYQRDLKGNIILNPTTLAPVPTTDRRVLGKGVFDWTGGLTSRFNYKNFSLNAVFDVKYGADIFSMTDLFSVVRGASKKTLPGREEWIQSEQERLAAKKTAGEWRSMGMVRGYVPEGVVQTGTDADGKPVYEKNTRAVDPSVYWANYYSDGNGIAVPFIYKATYVKVREITLSYRLPRNISNRLHIKDAQFGLVARNPFIIYKDIPNVDPDSNYNNGNGQGLEYGSLPSRRGWGFNLNVKF
ncbi:SusC/RagA family TonB-linked outer membrane protein [Chitinophaga sp. sic0106]|uniref:SusC/RagA family TonB-linked outer membrane protein n=1 Tax=Chitinophaga sp. sic0106 TaxID=2854785 RepID=UPI001C466D5A|nr:SusC/RagA family TonB-linked outer membrane protein [Chitinophaga sp. sic0106]MBV7529675.1 SusC/RagA family TonB-linked outer membrane protein [Chitinophaga sp. sic0106]